MNKRKRNVSLHLRLTETERDLIYERAKFCHIDSVTSYIRDMSIDGAIIVVDYSDIKRNNYLLANIANNINQIAKKVNTNNTVLKEDMDELKEMMDNIWQLQKSNLSTPL